MKKVLLSSVAALAVFAAAAPAFANDNPSVNGGANTPGAFDSREAYENQSEFVSARTVAELDAVEGGSHLYGEKKAAYEAAFNTAFLNVRNKYVQQFQTVQNTAKKKEGRYYILNETPEQANARYLKEHGISQDAANADAAKADAAKADAAKAEEAAKKAEAGKAGSKQAGKALPKTSAVK